MLVQPNAHYVVHEWVWVIQEAYRNARALTLVVRTDTNRTAIRYMSMGRLDSSVRGCGWEKPVASKPTLREFLPFCKVKRSVRVYSGDRSSSLARVGEL